MRAVVFSHQLVILIGASIVGIGCPTLLFSHQKAHADVIQGTISNWPESGPLQTIGDGANHVTLWWSINTFDKGWFYGSDSTGDSDVAFAVGVTDVMQIVDASVFPFTSSPSGPHCDSDCDEDGVGDFLIWREINTGHFGVLRIDDIDVTDINVPEATLDGTWWFQTDGTGNFVPEPSAIVLGYVAMLGFLSVRCRTGRSSGATGL